MTDARRDGDETALRQSLARARAGVVVGAVAAAAGVALAGSVDRRAGGALVVFAWGLLVAAIHRYGRLSSGR